MPIFVGEGAAESGEFAGALEEFSAVHADDFTVDVRGTVADEKGGEVREFFGSTEAVHGVAIKGEGFEVGTRKDAGECSLRRDGAGSDGVHADVAIAPFDGEAAG